MPEWVLRNGVLTKTVTLPEGQKPSGLMLAGEWVIAETPEQVEADHDAAAAVKTAAPKNVPAPEPVTEPTAEQASDPLNLDKE